MCLRLSPSTHRLAGIVDDSFMQPGIGKRSGLSSQLSVGRQSDAAIEEQAPFRRLALVRCILNYEVSQRYADYS